MELNEIKKKLYIEKPEALFFQMGKGMVWYLAHFKDGEKVEFAIPISDMGEATFYSVMDAKLLIRYLVK